MTIEERKYEEVREEIYNGLSDDKWMQQYICLVFDVIENKFKSYKQEHYNDMINEGVIGLLTARDKYDEEKGTKFITYAYISIQNAIIGYVRNLHGVRAGRNKWQRCYKKVKELVRQNIDYEQAWIEMRNTEIITRNDFYVLWMQATGADISYEMLQEQMEEFDVVDTEINIEQEVINRDTVDRVYKYINNNVKGKDKQEICRLYVECVLNGDTWIGADIAKRMGVTRQWVSQIQNEHKNLSYSLTNAICLLCT